MVKSRLIARNGPAGFAATGQRVPRAWAASRPGIRQIIVKDQWIIGFARAGTAFASG
jgi:hypothetical protein